MGIQAWETMEGMLGGLVVIFVSAVACKVVVRRLLQLRREVIVCSKKYGRFGELLGCCCVDEACC